MLFAFGSAKISQNETNKVNVKNIFVLRHFYKEVYKNISCVYLSRHTSKVKLKETNDKEYQWGNKNCQYPYSITHKHSPLPSAGVCSPKISELLQQSIASDRRRVYDVRKWLHLARVDAESANCPLQSNGQCPDCQSGFVYCRKK